MGRGSGRLHAQAAADQADGQALKLERLAGLHEDRLEVGVLGAQLDPVQVPVKALDGDFLTQPGDYDLAVGCFFGLLDGQQVGAVLLPVDVGGVFALLQHFLDGRDHHSIGTHDLLDDLTLFQLGSQHAQ